MSYPFPEFDPPFAALPQAVPDLELELEILQLRQKLNLEWANQWEHLLGVQRQQMCLLNSIFEGTPRWPRDPALVPPVPLIRRRNARERISLAASPVRAAEAR